MNDKTKIEWSDAPWNRVAGFALRDDRAGRFIFASLSRQTEGGVCYSRVLERRSWGVLVWRQFPHEQPTVTGAAVIAPRLNGPRRLLARCGLRSATFTGAAGYRFAYPVTAGAIVAVLLLVVAVLACAGGSTAWQVALIAATAPAIWERVGVVVGARSRWVRRIEDPAHLAVLGRVEDALNTLSGPQGGSPRLACTVGDVWWNAAASRAAAVLMAEDLERLVSYRARSGSTLSSGSEGRANSVPFWVPQQQSIPDLWARFYRVVDEHRLYETDIEKILAAPQLSDLGHPATAAFVTALVKTQDALQNVEEGAASANSATGTVHQLERSWAALESQAIAPAPTKKGSAQ